MYVISLGWDYIFFYIDLVCSVQILSEVLGSDVTETPLRPHSDVTETPVRPRGDVTEKHQFGPSVMSQNVCFPQCPRIVLNFKVWSWFLKRQGCMSVLGSVGGIRVEDG